MAIISILSLVIMLVCLQYSHIERSSCCFCHVACVLETSKPARLPVLREPAPISAQRQSVKVSREPQLSREFLSVPEMKTKACLDDRSDTALAEKQQGCVTSHKLVCSCHIKLSGTYESQKKRIWFVLEFFLHSSLARSSPSLAFSSSWPSIPLLKDTFLSSVSFSSSLAFWERKMSLHLCVTKRYLACFIAWYNIVIPSVLCDLAVS